MDFLFFSVFRFAHFSHLTATTSAEWKKRADIAGRAELPDVHVQHWNVGRRSELALGPELRVLRSDRVKTYKLSFFGLDSRLKLVNI